MTDQLTIEDAYRLEAEVERLTAALAAAEQTTEAALGCLKRRDAELAEALARIEHLEGLLP
jgi:hypothetical protein